MTPDQILQARSGLGMSSAQSKPSTELRGADLASKFMSFGQNQEQPQEDHVAKFLSDLVEAPATMAARPFQAAQSFGQYLGSDSAGLQKVSEQGTQLQQQLQRVILEGKAQGKDMSHAEKTLADVRATPDYAGQEANAENNFQPFSGGPVAPAPQNFGDVKKDVGRAAQTVALGVGSPLLAGAGIGFGSSLEQGNDILSPETAISTVIGGLTGKIMEVGFKAAEPYVTKAIEKYGTPLIDKLEKELPESAKPFLDKIRPAAKAAETVKQTTSAVSDIESAAIKDATPTYSEKLIGQPTVDGTPRVQENTGIKGLIGTRKVTSTVGDYSETSAGKELAKVEGYDPKETALNKFNTVQEDISKKAETLRASLKNEPLVIPKKEIASTVKTALKAASEDSLLLSKTDPALKNYTRVLTNALDEVKGNAEGILDLRQKLDSVYKNARGKMAFGDSKIAPLDELHTAARDALNKLLIDNAPNSNVKAAFKAQADLYRALDVLRQKAEAEGNSTIERLINKHPLGAKITKMAAHATGLGSVAHLAP